MLPGIFTFRRNGDTIEVMDNGQVVKKLPVPRNSRTGKTLEFFVSVEAKLLHDVDGDKPGDRYYKKGDIHFVELTPNGRLHLMDKDARATRFLSNATEGVDFEFV